MNFLPFMTSGFEMLFFSRQSIVYCDLSHLYFSIGKEEYRDLMPRVCLMQFEIDTKRISDLINVNAILFLHSPSLVL